MPVALAAFINHYFGAVVLLASALIIMVVNLQEALIFILTTGILGYILGSLLFKRGSLVTISASSITLTSNMMILTYAVAIPGFTVLEDSFSFISMLLLYLLFSLLYTSLWAYGFRRFVIYLLKIRLFEKYK